jgi:methylene-tetrahydromethanopterin dehydrogenase
MALDAGFNAVLPYTQVQSGEVTALVQDAMFSRPPKVGVRTGVFIGGKQAIAALDMLEAAKKALVPPFGVSFFVDPAGSFTTAAAMVACVEKQLRDKKKQNLVESRIAVFGATGVVGFSAGVIAALEKAEVTLVGYDGVKRVSEAAIEIKKRFGCEVKAVDGSDDGKKADVLAAHDVILCAGRAGVQILSEAQVAAAKNLLIVADVNAVPPVGVEGLDMMANGVELNANGALSIGPLAIGNIKYKTEFGLFKKMTKATRPVCFDFRDAFALARELNG